MPGELTQTSRANLARLETPEFVASALRQPLWLGHSTAKALAFKTVPSHDAELTRVRTQHLSAKRAYASVRHAGFCLRKAFHDTALASHVRFVLALFM